MKYYKIPEDEFRTILSDAFSFCALSNGGVDNWGGYGQSFRDFIETASRDDDQPYETLDDIVEHDMINCYLSADY